MDKQCAWEGAGRKGHLRIMTAILCFCVIFTAWPNAPVTLFVSAQEETPDAGTPEEDPSISGNTVDHGSDAGETQETTETVSGKGEVCLERLTVEETPQAVAREGEPETVWFDGNNNYSGEGSFQEAVKDVPNGGTIALLRDVSVEGPASISKNICITSYYSDRICTIKNTVPDTDDGIERGRIFTVKNVNFQLQNIILDGGRNEKATGYHPLVLVDNARVNLASGAILQNAENANKSLGGGAIGIRLGQVVMCGGSAITHCKAKTGGAIEINSKGNFQQAVFGMLGGSIRDCEAENGGGIYIGIGYAQMDDGSIEGCEAENGGGLYVNIGQLLMQSGKISGNRATGEDSEDETLRYGGGGIYIKGGSSPQQQASVVMNGSGKIAGNEAYNGGGVLLQGKYAALLMMDKAMIGGTAPGDGNEARCGGGVSVIYGNLQLFGGTVTGNTADMYGGGILGCPYGLIKLQGAPKVYGNTAGDASDRFDNLYLDGNEDEGTDVTLPIMLTGALTDGVRIGLSRWVRPDAGRHPYRDMIVSGGAYTMTKADSDRLAQTLEEENKQLYADNMERYAFIPYEGKIVMILPVDVELDKETLVFAEPGGTDTLVAAVAPENALIKDVRWSSSDETVARVDEHGVVTAVGKGEAVITAAAVLPYRAADTCTVKVAVYHEVAARQEHGKILYKPDGPLFEGQEVRLEVVPDKGYQLQEGSVRAFQSGDESAEVAISGEGFVMPGHDVTVTAVFEPIIYPITYHLDGGNLPSGDSNPAEYTIESADITLKNPERKGYRFKGWTGTDLSEASETVTIPAGTTGAREYTAVWEKMQSGKPKPEENEDKDKGKENGNGDEAADDTLSGIPAKQAGNNMMYGAVGARRAETVSGTGTAGRDSLNPQTGNDMAVWYMLAAASVIGLLLIGVLVCSCMKIHAYNRSLKENEQELAQICAVAGTADAVEGGFTASGEERGGCGRDGKGGMNEEEGLQVDFAALQERNEDIRGWLVCSGLAVNNPVVQAQDNSYYLRHSFMEKENRAGCIFMDYRNVSFEDQNVVIYGHNTTDGSMFGSLKEVLEDSFWEEKESGLIYLADTDNRLRVYQIFSFYVVENETYYITTAFESGEAYESFLKTIKGRSRRECGVAVTKEDHILTLSTCYGRAGSKKRLAIHAREVEYGEQ